MLKDYDSFDIQNAWYDMINKLATIYKAEWHQRIFADTMKKITYKDTANEYLRLVMPLMEVTNSETQLSKYAV